jgi:hypothetical protein
MAAPGCREDEFGLKMLIRSNQPVDLHLVNAGLVAKESRGTF